MNARRLSLAVVHGLALVVPLLSLAGATTPVQAADWHAFDACMVCHSSDKTLVGPSFAAIRERYGGQADADAALAERIAHGSSGRWGSAAMPANSQLTSDQALAAARWILRSKPSSTNATAAPPVSQPAAH